MCNGEVGAMDAAPAGHKKERINNVSDGIKALAVRICRYPQIPTSEVSASSFPGIAVHVVGYRSAILVRTAQAAYTE